MKDQDDIQAKIEKLPKWAQDHIRRITNQRDSVEKQLRKFQDDQTPEYFSVEEYVTLSNGNFESVIKHIQGHRMIVKACGVKMSLLVRDYGGPHGYPLIDISYDSIGPRKCDVVLEPRSHNQFHLRLAHCAKEKEVESEK